MGPSPRSVEEIVARARSNVSKRRTELLNEADERLHGPRGETRSRASVETTMILLDDVALDPTFTNCRLDPTDDDPSACTLERLAESMRTEGLKIPITVIESPGRVHRYFLRAGFRRTEAAKILGWKEIAANVLPADTPRAEEHWINILENTARSQLSSYEIANAARTMRDEFHVKPADFARRAGYSAGYVLNLLGCIDNLPDEIVEQWKRRAPIPIAMYHRWSLLSPIEALTQFRVYVGRKPITVQREMLPEPRTKKSRLAIMSSFGLQRMKQIRLSIEISKVLTEKERTLCLQVLDCCCGAREGIPHVHDPARKLRAARDRRQVTELDLPKLDDDD